LDLDIVCYITLGPVHGCDRFQPLQRLVLQQWKNRHNNTERHSGSTELAQEIRQTGVNDGIWCRYDSWSAFGKCTVYTGKYIGLITDEGIN
jgi:hypothetical protein